MALEEVDGISGAYVNRQIILHLNEDKALDEEGVKKILKNQSVFFEAAENFAKAKGFSYIRTETLSFQARPFYEKLGYKLFGELPDYPKGHTTYCLVKAL